MWRIKKIELEDFRSYKGRHVVELGDVSILWGRIGAGKTSVLYAVEYALFGRQLEVKERVAKLVDLINSEAQEARVVLELSDGSRAVAVERRLGRRGGEKLRVLAEGVEYVGDKAEEKLYELLGVDEDLYERLVYISHRTLEAFIYGTSQKRSLSVDRLFGIDVVDGVVKVISSTEKTLLEKAESLRSRLAAFEKYRDLIKKYGGYRAVSSRLSAVEEEIASLKRREEGLSALLEDLAKKRAAYVARARESEDLLLQYYRARSELEFLESAGEAPEVDVERLRDMFRVLIDEFEHMLDASLVERLGKARDVETLAVVLAEAYDALQKVYRDLESQLAETRRTYEQLLTRAKKLDEEISEVASRAKRLERSYQRFKELQKIYRSLDEARAALSKTKKRLVEVEGAVAFSTSLKTVASYVVEAGLSRCPVCGSPVSRDAAERVVKEVEEKFGQLLREAEELRAKLSELEKAVEELEALGGEVAEYLAAKARLDELTAEREEVVRKAIQAEKSVKQLEKRIERLREFFAKVDRRTISDAVSKYGRAMRIRELRKSLKELEERLKNLGLSEDALKTELRWREAAEEMEKVSSRLAELYKERSLLVTVVNEVGGDAEDLKKRLDNVLYAYGKLEEVKSRLELAKISARASLIQAVRERFNQVFQSIYKYGDITKVDADIEQRKGYYEFYALSPTGARYGISKLSDGQRLSIALSLALALREMSQIKLGFIIFDEPIPYVDVNVRKAFSELVKTLSERYQIILATQSREFAELLKTEVQNAKFYTVVKEETSRVVGGE
ncbi:MAG: SMC family ATPase [Pyrobaculum sp.]